MKVMSPIVEKARAHIRDVHIDSDYFKTYYDDVERPEAMNGFWSPGGRFFPMFQQLDIASVLDLACGHGRHTAQIIDQVESATLVDINLENIEACRRRFKDYPNLICLVNNGSDLSDLEDVSFTAVFSYDAMVHFEAMDIIAYIFEIFRVLKPGGRALLHYSINQENPEGGFHDSIYGRNFFSEPLMRHVANRAGFKILERKTFAWHEHKDPQITEGLILLEKPQTVP